jgi:hypothetical protein
MAVVGCGRRVAVLYMGGEYFACRHCYNLAYKSQRETKANRSYRGADKVRNKLGWQLGIANPLEEKPKGMHWKTYNRLVNRYFVYTNEAYRGMMESLIKLNIRIEHKLF